MTTLPKITAKMALREYRALAKQWPGMNNDHCAFWQNVLEETKSKSPQSIIKQFKQFVVDGEIVLDNEGPVFDYKSHADWQDTIFPNEH